MAVLEGGVASLWSSCALVLSGMSSVSSVGDEGLVPPLAVRRPSAAAAAEVEICVSSNVLETIILGNESKPKGTIFLNASAAAFADTIVDKRVFG